MIFELKFDYLRDAHNLLGRVFAQKNIFIDEKKIIRYFEYEMCP